MVASSSRSDSQPAGTISWLDDRLGTSRVRAWARTATVSAWPSAAVGGLLLLLLSLLATTGVLLLVWYRPGEQAWPSVARITHHVPYGWLVRGVHAASSHLLVLVLLLHAAATFRSGAWMRPRELTWLSGWALLLVALFAAFTGTLLVDDLGASTASQVASRLALAVPLVGPPVAHLLFSPTAAPDAVYRCFAVHVGMLPWLLVLACLGHVALVRVHGRSGSGQGLAIPIVPHAVARFGLLALATLAAVVLAAAAKTPAIGSRADVLVPTPAGTRPAWYFLPLYQLLRTLPGWADPIRAERVALTILGLLLATLMVVPVAFGHTQRSTRVVSAAILTAAAVLFAFGVWGALG